MNLKPNVKPIRGTKRVEFNCLHCGKKKEVYASSTSGKTYCSTKCSGAAKSAAIKEAQLEIPIEKRPCELCNSDFEVPRAHKEQRFCSKKCAKITNVVIEPTRDCAFCKTSFLVLSNNMDKKYCSVACSNRYKNTGKSLEQLKDNILPIRNVRVEALNAIQHEKLKDAQFISEKNTEPTVTVKKSDIYKFKCKTCDKLVVRYLSRGKPVPRFCSKKCTKWLHQDRKPVDTSSHIITKDEKPVQTYAEHTSVERTMLINILSLSLSLVSLLLCLYIVFGSSKIWASEIEASRRICRSPGIYSFTNPSMFETAAFKLDIDVKSVMSLFIKSKVNYMHIKNVAYPVSQTSFDISKRSLLSQLDWSDQEAPSSPFEFECD